MKVLRYYGPKQVQIEELPTPSLNSGEVLVKTRVCGVCGTDVKTYLRGHPKLPPGIVLGHEVTGVVSASKSDDFAPGDPVVVAPYAPCLSCQACARGHFSLCENLFDTFLEPGGFAEEVRIPERIVNQSLLLIPNSLDFETASLTEPLACCLHGLDALDIKAGQSLLIIGDGPMGLLQAAAAKAIGVEPIILSGMTPARLDYARKIVDYVVDVSEKDLSEIVEEVAPGGVENIMVSVANTDVAQEAMTLACKGGAINLFAGMPKSTVLQMDPYRIHYDEVSLHGTFGFGPSDFRRALTLLASGDLEIDGLITDKVRLDDAEDALLAAGQYEGIKTLVVMDAG